MICTIIYPSIYPVHEPRCTESDQTLEYIKLRSEKISLFLMGSKRYNLPNFLNFINRSDNVGLAPKFCFRVTLLTAICRQILKSFFIIEYRSDPLFTGTLNYKVCRPNAVLIWSSLITFPF